MEWLLTGNVSERRAMEAAASLFRERGRYRVQFDDAHFQVAVTRVTPRPTRESRFSFTFERKGQAMVVACENLEPTLEPGIVGNLAHKLGMGTWSKYTGRSILRKPRHQI